MSRSKADGNPRQNLLRTKRIRSTPKPDKSIFSPPLTLHRPFPLTSSLRCQRARGRDQHKCRHRSSRCVILTPNGKSASAKLKPPTTIVKTTKARASTTLKDVAPVTSLNRSQPPQGRKTAAGQQSLASTAPEIAQVQHQAAPRDEVHPSCPAAALPHLHNVPVDTPAEVRQLPRSAAVTVYRKNGPIDAIAYWLRSQGRSFSTLFKRPKSIALPKAAIIEINRLRLENLLLQRRIEMLMAEQHQVAQ